LKNFAVIDLKGAEAKLKLSSVYVRVLCAFSRHARESVHLYQLPELWTSFFHVLLTHSILLTPRQRHVVALWRCLLIPAKFL